MIRVGYMNEEKVQLGHIIPRLYHHFGLKCVETRYKEKNLYFM